MVTAATMIAAAGQRLRVAVLPPQRDDRDEQDPGAEREDPPCRPTPASRPRRPRRARRIALSHHRGPPVGMPVPRIIEARIRIIAPGTISVVTIRLTRGAARAAWRRAFWCGRRRMSARCR